MDYQKNDMLQIKKNLYVSKVKQFSGVHLWRGNLWQIEYINFCSRQGVHCAPVHMMKHYFVKDPSYMWDRLVFQGKIFIFSSEILTMILSVPHWHCSALLATISMCDKKYYCVILLHYVTLY
jgi:hypothetical protein